jgi:hypothetical protein
MPSSTVSSTTRTLYMEYRTVPQVGFACHSFSWNVSCWLSHTTPALQECSVCWCVKTSTFLHCTHQHAHVHESCNMIHVLEATCITATSKRLTPGARRKLRSKPASRAHHHSSRAAMISHHCTPCLCWEGSTQQPDQPATHQPAALREPNNTP